MRDEATDSARSRIRASASVSTRSRRLGVQPGNRSLGICDVGGDIPVERKATPDERVGEIGDIVAGATVATRYSTARDLAPPVTLQKLRQARLLIGA